MYTKYTSFMYDLSGAGDKSVEQGSEKTEHLHCKGPEKASLKRFIIYVASQTLSCSHPIFSTFHAGSFAMMTKKTQEVPDRFNGSFPSRLMSCHVVRPVFN